MVTSTRRPARGTRSLRLTQRTFQIWTSFLSTCVSKELKEHAFSRQKRVFLQVSGDTVAKERCPDLGGSLTKPSKGLAHREHVGRTRRDAIGSYITVLIRQDDLTCTRPVINKPAHTSQAVGKDATCLRDAPSQHPSHQLCRDTSLTRKFLLQRHFSGCEYAQGARGGA